MFSLYLHIPFCRRKCPYCDFFSLADRPEQLTDYHQLLISQLHLALDAGWQGPFDTVFFGGGTPSLLQPQQVAAIIDAVAATAGLTSDVEISLEANPATLSPDYLRQLRLAGINRLSLGVQSFNDLHLRLLERLHDARLALDAIHWARQAGFDNLSCDLMFALPGQTPEELDADLKILLSVAPEHVSIYGLGIEPGTPWAGRADLSLPDEEAYAAAYLRIDERLAAAGYHHYEISNFARPGRECRHNLGYWQRTSCLALGPGAHGFKACGWGERWFTPADLPRYREALTQARDPMTKLESFDRQGAMAETVYLALRTADGVDDVAFAARFGLSFKEAFARQIERLGGPLNRRPGGWFFGPRQWLVYDHLIQEFL